MTSITNAVEWLSNQIRWETDIEKLRAHAITLVSMVESEEVEDVYQKELEQDGYYEEVR